MRAALERLPLLLACLTSSAGCREPGPKEIYRQALPGVVTVVMVQGVNPAPPVGSAAPLAAEPGDDEVAPRPMPWVSASMGSGVLLDAKGLVVTTAHVLEGAERIGVVFSGSYRARAKVVGRDPLTDLALLQVKQVPASARPLPLRGGEEVEVGDAVLAIGNPDGLPATLTTGIVSGLHRRGSEGIRVFHDFLQTDAALFPGCSGGPLLDRRGRVVALVTAVDRERRGAGFAIPSHRALPILQRLSEEGTVVRGWIGVTAKDLEGWLEQRLGLGEGEGAEVWRLLADGPAEQAGLLAGDVVLQAGQETVHGRRDLAWAVGLTRPGATLPLKVLRQGKVLELVVVPAARPDPPPEGGKNAF